MDRTNKNKNRKLTDFLRYRKGEMTGEERNSFERGLQKDPFAEEASEGFSQITAEEAEFDLSSLGKRIERKIRKRSPAIYYRVAAAVAILVTISVIVFNKQSMKEEMTLSKNNNEEVKVPLTIAAVEPLTDKTERSETGNKSQSPTLPTIPSPFPEMVNPEKKEIIGEVTDTDEIMAEQNSDMDPGALNKDLIVLSAVGEVDAMPVEAEKKMEDSRVAGVSLQTQSQSLAAARSKSAFYHIPPQPLVGLDSFNIWLGKNIRNPEPDNKNEEVVIISFKVMHDSTITDLKIISSPAEAYAREAKRLIKEGPLWKPAMIDGNPVEEEYRITIRLR